MGSLLGYAKGHVPFMVKMRAQEAAHNQAKIDRWYRMPWRLRVLDWFGNKVRSLSWWLKRAPERWQNEDQFAEWRAEAAHKRDDLTS